MMDIRFTAGPLPGFRSYEEIDIDAVVDTILDVPCCVQVLDAGNIDFTDSENRRNQQIGLAAGDVVKAAEGFLFLTVIHAGLATTVTKIRVCYI